jgi:hypothetical protein
MNKTKLDINVIETNNLQTLGILDISRYKTSFIVTNPTIKITPPSLPEIALAFTPNSLQIWDSTSLGITCAWCDKIDLPDGLWTVEYNVYPSTEYKVNKTFLRVESIQAKLDELYLTLDFTVCDNTLSKVLTDKLKKIEFLLVAAKSANSKCSNKLAMELYSEAFHLINKFSCK